MQQTVDFVTLVYFAGKRAAFVAQRKRIRVSILLRFSPRFTHKFFPSDSRKTSDSAVVLRLSSREFTVPPRSDSPARTGEAGSTQEWPSLRVGVARRVRVEGRGVHPLCFDSRASLAIRFVFSRAMPSELE